MELAPRAASEDTRAPLVLHLNPISNARTACLASCDTYRRHVPYAQRLRVRAQGTPGAQGGSSPIATSIASRTSGYEKSDGFIPLYLDPRQGKLLLELPHDSTRALLVVTQATGLGSNPIGIDRGSDAGTDVVRFDRDGERVLVVLENWSYRSSALGNADHQRTVREAFAPSTVASLPIVAAESGRLLVDATDLVMRDWNRVGETLGDEPSGNVHGGSRSLVDLSVRTPRHFRRIRRSTSR